MFDEITSHAHGILVHFPIALILVAVLFDLVRAIWKRALPTKGSGLALWVVASLGSVVSVLTGPEEDARGNTTIFHTHENYAHLTMIVSFVVVAIRLFLWWRKSEKIKGFMLLFYLLAGLVTAGLVLTTGYYGGKMVYDQGIGVKVNGKSVNPPKAGHFGHDGDDD